MIFILFHGINALWNFNIFPLIMCSKHYHVVFGRSISNSWARTCLVCVFVWYFDPSKPYRGKHNFTEWRLTPVLPPLEHIHQPLSLGKLYSNTVSTIFHSSLYNYLNYIVFFFHSPSCSFHVSYRALINIFDFPIHFHIQF